jgi:hypothetical protein
MPRVPSFSGPPHTRQRHPPRAWRGSRKRLRRIKFRENTSVEFWIFVALVIVMLAVIMPWLLVRATH